MHINKYMISGKFDNISTKRKISGTVNSEGTSRKSIAVFDRRTREQLGSTLAEDTGYWEIYLPIREDENLFIICFDEGLEFNADIYDRVSLCAETFGELTNYENIIIKNEKFLDIPFSSFRSSDICTIPSAEMNQTIDLDFDKYITTIYRSIGYFEVLLGSSFDSINVIANENISTSVAVTNDDLTYSVYNSAWRNIASMDEGVHGDIGDSDWHYRDNNNIWSKYGTGANIAISKAFEYENNLITPDDFLALDTSAFNLIFNSTNGILNIAVGVKNYVESPWNKEPSLLIHSNAIDDSDIFLDSSAYNHTIIPNGNARHKIDQAKIGTTSIYFDGASKLILQDSDEFKFDADFTVDFWVYPVGSSGSLGLVNYESVNKLHSLYFDTQTSGRVLINGANAITGIIFPASAWSHYALVRYGTTLSAYVNGTLAGSTTLSGIIGGLTKNYIGASTSTHFGKGYIDEFRVTKGSAEWTGNFTPSESPYGKGNGVNRIIINNKNFWKSNIYDLTNSNGFVSSQISWNYRSYDQNFNVFVFKTGDTSWSECTNGNSVPGLIQGVSTIGMEIQFKVEFEFSASTEEIFLEFELS